MATRNYEGWAETALTGQLKGLLSGQAKGVRGPLAELKTPKSIARRVALIGEVLEELARRERDPQFAQLDADAARTGRDAAEEWHGFDEAVGLVTMAAADADDVEYSVPAATAELADLKRRDGEIDYDDADEFAVLLNRCSHFESTIHWLIAALQAGRADVGKDEGGHQLARLDWSDATGTAVAICECGAEFEANGLDGNAEGRRQMADIRRQLHAEQLRRAELDGTDDDDDPDPEPGTPAPWLAELRAKAAERKARQEADRTERQRQRDERIATRNAADARKYSSPEPTPPTPTAKRPRRLADRLAERMAAEPPQHVERNGTASPPTGGGCASPATGPRRAAGGSTATGRSTSAGAATAARSAGDGSRKPSWNRCGASSAGASGPRPRLRSRNGWWNCAGRRWPRSRPAASRLRWPCTAPTLRRR